MTDQKSTVSAVIRPKILDMQAYHVPPAKGMVKLDAMENPYGWPAELKQRWLDRLGDASINRYPDPGAQAIKQRLLALEGLAEPVDVLFGNGSDELIQIIIQSLAINAGPVLSVAPAFVMYKLLSDIIGKDCVEVPLKPDFSLDGVAVLEAIDRHHPACVFLAWPNNPTGNLFDRQAVDAIVARAPGLVVIDEAYLPFADNTLIGWLADHPNLLVMRTLSKAGLAGLRFGMLFGNRTWLDEFDKIRLPYNINCLTQASVAFALDHLDHFSRQAREIVGQRDRVYNRLAGLDGLEVYPSEANFILFRTTRVNATDVFAQLLDKHILVKNLHQPGKLLDQCLRVTIGTPQENDQFLDALEQTLQELT